MQARNFAAIHSTDVLQALADKLLADGKPVGFDVETGYNGPDREKGSLQPDWDEQFICGFSITNDTGWARYVPVAHQVGVNVDEHSAWEIIKPVLETLPVIAHNAKFEIRNLRAIGRKGRGPRIDANIVGDSILQSYVLSEWPLHNLKYLTKNIFGYDQAEIETLFPGATQKALKALRFNVLELTQEVIDYACDDAVWTLALNEHFLPKIESSVDRARIYDLEMREMIVVADMEEAGHAVDWESLTAARQDAEPFLASMVTAAREGLGKMADADLSSLNLNSSPQMRKVLYEDLGLPYTRLTDKGAPSTDKIALEALSRQYPAVKKILESREVKNLANRMKKWTTEYNISHDKRVHANFNQVVVGSGRFSANDPAIQQLPKKWIWTTFLKVKTKNEEHMAAVRERATFGKHYWEGNFRNFLVAAEGCYLLGFDYSQIELRCMAGMSQEPALLEAFANGVDVHTLTAAMMLGKAVEDVTPADRDIGKTQNFAILYGMGVKSLADRLALSMEDAERLYNTYFSQFTKVTEWMNRMKVFGLSRGYIETYFGRKWTLWDLQSNSRAQQGKGARLCVNGPVQGTAADYMKISMLRAREALVKKGWWMTKVRLINNLHDALTFEADNDINPKELREILQAAVVWDVPSFPKIVADWEIGQKWGSSARWKDQEVEFLEGIWQLTETIAVPEKDDLTEEDFGIVSEYDENGEPTVREVKTQVPSLLVVKTTEMPTDEGFQRFMEMVNGNLGKTTLRFKTPEGEVDLPQKVSLTPEHQGRISLLLGGASVYFEASIDVASMSEGLGL